MFIAMLDVSRCVQGLPMVDIGTDDLVIFVQLDSGLGPTWT